MENVLPSDIWRVHVLPCLDLVSRIEMNRTLDPETRVTKNVKVGYRALADKMAIDNVKIILRRIENSTVDLVRVKGSINLFRFVQSGVGRMMFKYGRFADTMLRKIDQLEMMHSKTWWNRSPYRKKLRVEMERVRDIILHAV